MSSRVRRLASFVGDHDPPDVVGEAPFEAAHGLVVRLALADLEVVVGAAGAGAHADLGERGDVQGQVELAISAAGQPVPGAVGAGHLDRGDAGVAGERRGGGEPAGPAGAAEQSGGHDRADPVDVGQPAAVLGDDLGHLGRQLGQPGVEIPDLGDQVAPDLLTDRFGRPDWPHRGQRPGGPVGGQVGVGAAGDQLAQQRVQLVDQPGAMRGQVGAPLIQQREHR